MQTPRWTFYFNENSERSDSKVVQSDAVTEYEDERIRTFMRKTPKGTLYLPGNVLEVWVNLEYVKCVSRQMVDLEELRRLHQQKDQA